MSDVRLRTPRQLPQVSPRSPTPLLFAAIRVADQRRRARQWASRGISGKNAGMALPLQIPKPYAVRYLSEHCYTRKLPGRKNYLVALTSPASRRILCLPLFEIAG